MSGGEAVSVREIGRFVYVGPKEYRGEDIELMLENNIRLLLEELYDGMIKPYQTPTRHPVPQIPMAAADYKVTITSKRKVDELLKKQGRKKYARRKVRKKVTHGKFKETMLGMREYLIGRRLSYHMFKRKWRERWKKDSELSAKQLARIQKRKDARMKLKKLSKTRLGKLLGIGYKQKRGRKPKISFGYDKLIPLSRTRKTPNKRKRGFSKTIIVKPGRLRRYAGRGLVWHGAIFAKGISVKWGIPQMGGGRFFNYSMAVERNPKAGTREGTGKSPYVRRVMEYISSECQIMERGMNAAYGQAYGSYITEYRDDEVRVPLERSGAAKVVRFYPTYQFLDR